MPRKRQAARPVTTKTRRSTRQNASPVEAVPDVYREMLVEAYHSNPADFHPQTRPAKRRKLNEPPQFTSPREPSATPSEVSVASEARPQPTIYDDFEETDESDAEFEDVELTKDAKDEVSDDEPGEKSLQLDLSTDKTATIKQTVQRRKPVTKAERQLRLDVHKWHLLCLIIHIAVRNQWCDSEQVQSVLKPLIPRKVISLLHVDESKLPSQRNFAFINGLEEICTIWRLHWKIIARGMRRATWREKIDMDKEIDNAEEPIDFEDFKNAAQQCSGSRDLGAQLFCALLRAVAVETRLVCSLQVLPFSGVAKGETPQKPKPTYVRAEVQDYGESSATTLKPSKTKRKRIVDSPYPVFWVEVYNSATSQWMPVDPLVRHTINKPRTGFEPPASDGLNSMSYVLAFEDDGSATDVTRRYVTWYNAKTRKLRVESTKNGETWWARVMRHFRKRIPEIRDEIEEGLLVKRVASEGMPKSVQDFRNHPIYVLERHLKSNEVIEPKREVGKVTTGSGKTSKIESVYRRQDVHLCRSADAWYRRGRDVKQEQQPLKLIHGRMRGRTREMTPPEEDGESEGVTLYAEYQTEIYIPPPIVDGRVPRNAYGNLDVYVSSMIPAGGVHVQHPLAAQAAKSLKLNYADAVTGFQFKGRQGTAIVHGVIVDQRYAAAMIATVEGLEEQSQQDVTERRNLILFNIWKRMLMALRVRQRIHQEYGENSSSGDQLELGEDDNDSSYRDGNESGGFVPDDVEATEATKADEITKLTNMKDRLPTVLPDEVIRRPVTVIRSPHKIHTPDNEDKNAHDLFGSDVESNDNDTVLSGGFLEGEGNSNEQGKLFGGEDAIGGGGFVIEGAEEPEEYAFLSGSDPNHGGGGFIMDSETDDIALSTTGMGNELPDPNNAESPNKFPRNINHIQRETSRQVDENAVTTLFKETIPVNDRDKLDDKNTSKQKSHKVVGNSETDSDSISQASLLSHDPNEDDADPQWLEDAFESD